MRTKPIIWALVAISSLCTSLGHSQTLNSSENVYVRQGVHITATIHESGDTIMFWQAQNHAYQHIVDIITLYSGRPIEVVEFIKLAIDFYDNNDPGTSMQLNDLTLSINQVLGKYLDIYPKLGYRRFTSNELNRILRDVQRWLNK